MPSTAPPAIGTRPGRSSPDVPRAEAVLLSALDAVALLPVGEGDLHAMVSAYADLVVRGVEPARGAGVLLGDPAEPTLLVSTDRIVQAMDGAQHRAGQGPAWDAYGSDAPVSTAGPAADDRWPRLRPLVPAGTQALLAVPLPGAAGVLTLIGTPALTGSRQLRRAQAFAAAGAAMLREHAAIGVLRRQVGQLEAGLDARAPIEQAKGILMGRYGLDAAGAFAELSRRSQCSNVKVREVARRLVAEVCRVLPPDLPDWDEPLPEGTAGTGPPEFHLTPP